MTQTWDPQAYNREGSFVHKLAGGVVEWLMRSPASASSILLAAMGS